MSLPKILFGLVAAGYLVSAFSLLGPGAGSRVLIFLLLPMSCIWFSEELGEFTGHWGMDHIDKKSPGWAVALSGWVLLLLPPLAILVLHLTVKR